MRTYLYEQYAAAVLEFPTPNAGVYYGCEGTLFTSSSEGGGEVWPPMCNVTVAERGRRNLQQ